MNAPPDPLVLFQRWFADARDTETSLPEAMALSTVDPDGRPSSRMVLLKESGDDDFVFYTHYASRKGQAIAHNPHAALLFHWKQTKRQVRIEGRVERVSMATSDAYFATRHRSSQLGAWASDQSQVIIEGESLEARVKALEQRFSNQEVPRPEGWGGYRVHAESIEFWEERPGRLHWRCRFDRTVDGWRNRHLYP